MREFTVSELAMAIGGTIEGNDKGVFSYISIDSRTISDKDNTVFFAIEGRARDGHEFIPELIRKKLKVFVVSNDFKIPDADKNITFIHVKSVLGALQLFGGFVRSAFNGPVVGITGSNGKTIVKEWIFHIFRNSHNVFRSPRSYNSQLGVPLSLSLIENSYDIAVIEAGISQPGEMFRLERIIQPDIGIITNIGESHQENFSTYHEKLSEKLTLFKNSNSIIYCRDHPDIHETIVTQLQGNIQKVSWGFHKESTYRLSEVNKSAKESAIKLVGFTEIFKIPFTDEASFENAMHSLVLALFMGIPVKNAAEYLSSLEPVELRMQILKGINSNTLINDSYSSDIRSLEIALNLLLQQKQHKKHVLILSDIFQSGKSGEELYSGIAALAKLKNVDIIIGIGPDISRYRDLFTGESNFFASTEEFIHSAYWNNLRNSAILIKGARSFEFEKISRILQEKSHKTIMEINLASLISNYNAFRSLLAPGTRIMAMVKAFSYGSGSYEIAHKMQFHKADYLAVAFADEGVELRKQGIVLPIMVMNPDPSSFWTIVDYKLEPELYSKEVLDDFIKFADSNALIAYPVHIKLDTGMHRLGFMREDIPYLLSTLPSSLIEIVSVFSHLSAAENPDHDSFTRHQISEFIELCSLIRGKTGRDFIRHILNSAGIERFPEAHLEMVRLGIGLYGVTNGGKLLLREVSTFKTHISMIKEVRAGQSVGYSRGSIENHSRKIATIPVGYADGMSRTLGMGKGKFKINNQLVSVVGNVCMDMCMLDVTGLNVKPGDEVILFGPDHSVNNLANASGTIAYEILTSIPERVKRIYIEE
jgi:Alr-MurF fusion protein